jgi:HTH-type transcriptional regulator / antitoxin HipB
MQQTIATSHQISQILAAGRCRAGLTQAQGGLRIGTSQSRISAFEADSGSITLDQLLALLSAYGLQLQVQDKGEAAAAPDSTTVER